MFSTATLNLILQELRLIQTRLSQLEHTLLSQPPPPRHPPLTPADQTLQPLDTSATSLSM